MQSKGEHGNYNIIVTLWASSHLSMHTGIIPYYALVDPMKTPCLIEQLVTFLGGKLKSVTFRRACELKINKIKREKNWREREREGGEILFHWEQTNHCGVSCVVLKHRVAKFDIQTLWLTFCLFNQMSIQGNRAWEHDATYLHICTCVQSHQLNFTSNISKISICIHKKRRRQCYL